MSPLLDPDKLKSENNIQDKDMYFQLLSNYDELKSFLSDIKFIKKNQHYLELNPMVDGREKIKTLENLELKSINLESKMSKMSDNIDNLMQNYNETIDIINKKFALYNELLDNKGK